MAITETPKKSDLYRDKEIEGFKNLAGLIRGYFDLGGMQVQFNVISNDKLQDAQKHPDKYKDLLIRVAGYSALFVDLDPQIQNDIIERTEHGL